MEPTRLLLDDVGPRRISWRDLVWITWRQHRALLLVSALATAAVCGVLLTYAALLHHYAGCIRVDDSSVGSCANNYLVSARNLADVLRGLLIVPPLVAGFWGAPLVAREIESGTLALALGQDLSPRRWLVAKVTVLSTVLVSLALAVAACGRAAMPTRGTIVSSYYGDGFDRKIFETGPLPFVGYVLLAFVLGVAVGALVKRTLPSVASAGAASFAIWYLLRALRAHYLPARTVTTRSDTSTSATSGGWTLHTVVHGDRSSLVTYVYQPANRLRWFELTECGICVAVAACLLVLSLTLVRRRGVTT